MSSSSHQRAYQACFWQKESMTECSNVCPATGGSRSFIDLFFPSAASLLDRSGFLDQFFPAWTQEACPVLVTHIGRAELRWLTLAPFCLLGIVVGACGAALLGGQRGLEHGWSASCIFFALMNLSALPTHVLLQPSISSLR